MPLLLPMSLLFPPTVADRRSRAAGKLEVLPILPAGADTLALAELAGRDGLLFVVAASPLEAQRLVDELPWFAPQLRVRLFPDWETLPYDGFSPHQDLISERLAALNALTRGECDVLVTAATTALMRMAPPSFLIGHSFLLKKRDRLVIETLREQMQRAGYQTVTQVVAAGEVAYRGGLIDLFPMGAALPYRIELFDDDVESIRCFDVDTQRSLYPVAEIHLLPAREFPVGEAGRNVFRRRFREAFEGDASRCALYKEVSQGILPAGIEYYLPLFFDETATLFDYLPAGTTMVLHGDVAAALAAFWQELKSRYGLLAGDKTRPILPPGELYLRDEEFFLRASALPRLALKVSPAGTAYHLPSLAVDRSASDPLALLKNFLASFSGRVLLIAESPGRRETLAEFLAGHGVQAMPCADFTAFVASEAPLMLTAAPLSGGFLLPDASLALVTENELYVATARPRGSKREGRRTNLENWLRDLSELKVGDPVVHEAHGIGRYQGLVHLNVGSGEAEFLHLEYADGATLYVPAAHLHVISRYSGADPEAVELHRLGSGQWEKAKRKAAMQVRDTAAELLHLYAQRTARQGHRFDIEEHALEAFATGFGFEETPDQRAAIDAVIEDMRSGRPMDRLVCGDVGFGKTEVALRAAFIAVMDGKQVAVLCPTTLLCEQHFRNFTDRFALIEQLGPVHIAELSRFRNAKEQAEALRGIERGSVDIVIGTHRLLQKDVRFARLGLVIIDEEHRFGVRQKETLKALRTEVDVLTLTATPIPRTLGLALEGLRDFSVIATPPQRRLAIKTFVSRWADGLVREAALREFKRGGQVYFLHNEVETIENMRTRLEKLLPEARIIVGHGQMPERELERVMREFTQQKHNVLLCSTIIETGIDNPHANTIIINRADRFGLAQLHQLRGRVGRSHHQAYAYLLTDAEAKPTAQAQRRLEAIQAMEELGSGFFLAMHDLEIRGAGEVLGENQSGEMQQVGFALYVSMLNTAVKALKEGREIPDLTAPLAVVAEIDLGLPALLPNDYCPDVHERLTLYKRLANCETLDELTSLREELIDRFGELPPQGQTLIETHRLRLLGKPLGVRKLDAGPHGISVQLIEQPPIDPMNIVRLLQGDRNIRLAGQDKLSWKKETATLQTRVAAIRELFAKLSGEKATMARR